MPSPVAPVISATLPSRLTSEHRRNQRRTATVPPPAALRCHRAVGHALVQDLVSIGKLRVCARLEACGAAAVVADLRVRTRNAPKLQKRTRGVGWGPGETPKVPNKLRTQHPAAGNVKPPNKLCLR